MRRIDQRAFSFWIVATGFILLLYGSVAHAQPRDRNRNESGPMKADDEKGRFIAAFDWSVERSYDFVWPFESIRPAPYESVVMVVEQMPRGWPEKTGKRVSVPLLASRHLRINGRLQKPRRSRDGDRTTGPKEEYLVYLDQGRLRLSLSLPPGFRFDAQYTIIRIKLYQTKKVG